MGLPHPEASLADAQLMTNLLTEVRLTPEQRHQIFTSTLLKYDYDGAVAALRILYPSVGCTDVPYIKPVTSTKQRSRRAISRDYLIL